MLIVWFTTNRMCAKNKNICMWREQAIEWSRRVISIVACCHSAKLCAHATRDFQSQQNGAATRTWSSCRVRPLHKEHAISAVRRKKGRDVVATSLVVFCWLCDSPRTGCAQRRAPYIYVARTSNKRVILSGDLYCCLLPRCKALRIWRSGFPIATGKQGPNNKK